MNAMRFWPWWVRISNKRTSLFFCLFTRLQERFLSRLPNSVSKKTNRSCHYGDMKNRICFRDINKGARCFLQRNATSDFSFLFLLVGFYWNVATKHDSQLPSCQIGMVSHVRRNTVVVPTDGWSYPRHALAIHYASRGHNGPPPNGIPYKKTNLVTVLRFDGAKCNCISSQLRIQYTRTPPWFYILCDYVVQLSWLVFLF